MAVRESLPWSFAGLLLSLPIFFVLTHQLAKAELPAFGVMAIALAAILSYRLARKLQLSAPLSVTATMLAFALTAPQPYHATIGYLYLLGQTGLFLAIMVALAVAAASYYGGVSGAIAVVALAAALFALHLSPANALGHLLQPLGALGDSAGALFAIVIAETLLWLVGIHGPAALAAIVTPVYLTLQAQNTAAYAQHRPLPHIVVVSLFLFVFPGGAGAVLPLAFFLLFARTERLRNIARATILPAIFNLSEPLLFGLPIVANPFLAIPFVLAPLLTAATTYFAVEHQLVARAAWYVPSMIPTPIATYLATLDPRAVILAMVNIALAAAIYAPFVRAYDRHESAIA